MSELRNRRPTVVTQPRPTRQIAAMGFAAGLAVAAVVGFFFDSRQGGARRHMTYDKVVATGRGLGRWSGKKARHWRNKATGTLAEMKSGDSETQRVAGSGP